MEPVSGVDGIDFDHFEINAAGEVDQRHLKLDVIESPEYLSRYRIPSAPTSLHHRYETAPRGPYAGRLESIP